MAITPLPSAPSRADPVNFSARADALLTALPTFVTETNALAASITAGASSASSIPYTFSTSTADADPGNGFLRFDNATQSSATTIRLDLLGADAVDYTNVLALFSASTSVIKGQIRITKVGDTTKFMIFNVTALAVPAGYRNATVAYVTGSGASPFANNDALTLVFTRNGDIGSVGMINYGYFNAREMQASGTVGGTSSNGANVRVLNTVVTNTISGASLSSNTITLPAGTYQIYARAPSYGTQHKLTLFNTTDSATTIVGSSVFSGASAAGDSVVIGQFTISASKNFQLVHLIPASSGVNSLGYPLSYSGVAEIYTEVQIIKAA
jgi:hypothetical protein